MENYFKVITCHTSLKMSRLEGCLVRSSWVVSKSHLSTNICEAKKAETKE